MGLEIIPLFSGSRGNSTLVRFDGVNILIDVGVRVKTLEKRLKTEGLCIADIDGVLLTHAHGDHISGLADLPDGVKIYAHPNTLKGLKFQKEGCEAVEREFEVKGVKITPFPLSHDVYCVGYKMEKENESFCYLTDMGVFEERNFPIIRSANTVFLEANHDVEMLKKGRYPYLLKQRIRSNLGHLSNDCCAELCARLYESGTRTFILGHLSEENNCPELAFSVVDEALKALGNDYKLFVALRNGLQ